MKPRLPMVQMMRLPLVFVLGLLTLTSSSNNTETNPSSTTVTETYTLCLTVNRITLTGIKWISQMKWAPTEGIFYAYNPIHSIETFQSFKFPIVPTATDTGTEVLPTQFNFKDDASSVFCWKSPTFSELNLRFKVYELYHTALKAISAVHITSEASTKVSLDLITLPYQYSNANVSVNFTLTWNTHGGMLVLAPSVPEGPPIPPVQPPVDSDAVMDILTDNIIADGQALVTPASASAKNVESGVVMGESESSTDLMLIAAICSSLLGLFILLYICVWAYKSYGRKEYQSIPSINSCDHILRRKRISLRNVGVGNKNDEQKHIMHPSESYTCNDQSLI